MPDVFLYQGESNPSDVKLTDPTVLLSSGVTVIPATLSLTLAGFAPVVPSVAIPAAAALVTSTLAPQVPSVVTPSTISLTTATFAPQVPVQVTPSTLALSLTGFAPQTPYIVTPSTATLTLLTFAPTIAQGTNVIPGTASLVTVTFAPLVPSVVTPSTLALSFTRSAPTVPIVVTPSTTALTLATFAPNVTTTAGTTVIPDTASLTLTTFAPLLVLIAPPQTGGSYWWSRIGQVKNRTWGKLNFYLPKFSLSLRGSVKDTERFGRLLAFPHLKLKGNLSGTVGVSGAVNLIIPVPRLKLHGAITMRPVAASLHASVPLPVCDLTGSVGVQGTVRMSVSISQIAFRGTVPRVVEEYAGIKFYSDNSLSFDVPEGYEVSVIVIPAGAEEYFDVPLDVLEPIIQSATKNVSS